MTSQTWEQHDSYKPDIVMEGGNHILDDDPLFSRATNHTLLLTTNKNYPNQPLDGLAKPAPPQRDLPDWQLGSKPHIQILKPKPFAAWRSISPDGPPTILPRSNHPTPPPI